jgi:hypothetical protein
MCQQWRQDWLPSASAHPDLLTLDLLTLDSLTLDSPTQDK